MEVLLPGKKKKNNQQTKQTPQTKTPHSKQTAHSILSVFAPLHHCTNKHSPSKTPTTSLISPSSLDSVLTHVVADWVQQSLKQWFRFNYGSRTKNKIKLCCFNELSVHWTFGPGEDRACFSPTHQSCGAEISWELRLGKCPPLLKVFSIASVHRHPHTHFEDYVR